MSWLLGSCFGSTGGGALSVYQLYFASSCKRLKYIQSQKDAHCQKDCHSSNRQDVLCLHLHPTLGTLSASGGAGPDNCLPHLSPNQFITSEPLRTEALHSLFFNSNSQDSSAHFANHIISWHHFSGNKSRARKKSKLPISLHGHWSRNGENGRWITPRRIVKEICRNDSNEWLTKRVLN